MSQKFHPHPEQRSGEIVLGYVSSPEEFKDLNWRTKRCGARGPRYDPRTGMAVPDAEPAAYPVFIQRSEAATAGIDPDSLSRIGCRSRRQSVRN